MRTLISSKLVTTFIRGRPWCLQPSSTDCSKYKMLPSEERFCYEIYAPICGSDDKTYDNDCYFCYEVEKTNNKLKFVHFGKC
ncbi:serine protease inhibitor Kazal-type 9 [Bubalus bubalis]|uniref:serine protease inhibitor Kazal-type 9 n=1 Tax=Bubalus bubalis TaxID=89462 RepID=UPI001E1B75FE|nr:serine protease inhibitor Kazal-type 9 [Bubalus bubalis]